MQARHNNDREGLRAVLLALWTSEETAYRCALAAAAAAEDDGRRRALAAMAEHCARVMLEVATAATARFGRSWRGPLRKAPDASPAGDINGLYKALGGADALLECLHELATTSTDASLSIPAARWRAERARLIAALADASEATAPVRRHPPRAQPASEA